MEIFVEFTGLARSIVGCKDIKLKIDDKAIFRDIVHLLGINYPGLKGILINDDGETFLSSNMFVINGDMTTPAMVMDEHPHHGDRLVLMSLITGG